MLSYLTPEEARRKERERQTMVEGLTIWRQQKEQNTIQKIKDKNEMRSLLANYWPWGRPGGGAPNGHLLGLKNLYLDGVYPEEDMQKAKRHVGLIPFGRRAVGAPHITRPTPKQIRFKEDPALRFQWGEDMRRSVDNTLRYRVKREDQEIYRRQLDAMIEEKRVAKETEKAKKIEFERKMTVINDTAIKHEREELSKDKNILRKDYEAYQARGRDSIQKWDSQFSRPSKDGGVELVPLLTEQKPEIGKTASTSTDVTKGDGMVAGWKTSEPQYLKELTQQVNYKHQQNEDARVEDVEVCRKHFETLGNFWGRPGHGARRSATYKGRLDLMLYPQQLSVH